MKKKVLFYSSIQSEKCKYHKLPPLYPYICMCNIQGPQMNRKKKKTGIILLPDSMFDHGHDSELDCNDTGSDPIKRI